MNQVRFLGGTNQCNPDFVQVMGGASPDGFQYMTLRSCQSSGGEQSTGAGAGPSKFTFNSSLDSKNSGSKSQK